MNLEDASTFAAVQVALARDARRLNEEELLPLDLTRVATRLGVSIVLDGKLAPSHGALEQRAGATTVVVGGRSLHRAKTRFTAAHELGHHLLDRYGVRRPTSGRAYWLTEELCHYFAGRLLIPDRVLEWMLGREPQRSLDLLELIRRVALAAGVSRAAASHRVAQDTPAVAFSEVLYPTSARKQLAGIVDWVVERFPWLRVGAGRHLPGEHFLGPLLRFQHRRPIGYVAVGPANGLELAAERRARGIWVVCLAVAHVTDDPRRPGQLGLPVGYG